MVSTGPNLYDVQALSLDSNLRTKISKLKVTIVRSQQDDPPRTTFFNVKAMNFEQSAHRQYFITYGLITPLSERMVHKNQIFATHSYIWLLVFVIIQDEYLIYIADVLYLWLNCLFRSDIFSVYGFPLTK
ncbi:hypothetical protein THRCLA_20089 [Thraustotheca clavata]|uniref:Uncharacterized protein n=1 Tax=Thraustotheca clavata TaxID=74557 RepID=A0A1W0ABK9_9STRA|nr:hypothetical protein THRCLA_20089 [Thraustotheca clavata]